MSPTSPGIWSKLSWQNNGVLRRGTIRHPPDRDAKKAEYTARPIGRNDSRRPVPYPKVSSPSEVTFHVPRANLSIRRSGHQGLQLRPLPDPVCTGPSWFPLQVVGPLGECLASLVQALPDRVLRGATWPPDALRRVPTPGLAPGLDPGSAILGDITCPRFCGPHEGVLNHSLSDPYLPWFEVFYKLLNILADCTVKGKESQWQELLVSLHTLPIPEPRVPVHLGVHSYFTVPDIRELPSIPENRNLTEYFVAVDVNNMLHLYASMLYERRILICCSKLSTLTACVHGSAAMLFPMYWQHVYIPVLPQHLLDYCW
ncbi:hypothetical protein AMECASPLE_026074 [Ameca splendens]|uniref:UDENN domain-containing protein n=1 Tax=Ameca splendens TaxID=208324 RepID=A0ABV0YG04_9TELE